MQIVLISIFSVSTFPGDVSRAHSQGLSLSLFFPSSLPVVMQKYYWDNCEKGWKHDYCWRHLRLLTWHSLHRTHRNRTSFAAWARPCSSSRIRLGLWRWWWWWWCRSSTWTWRFWWPWWKAQQTKESSAFAKKSGKKLQQAFNSQLWRKQDQSVAKLWKCCCQPSSSAVTAKGQSFSHRRFLHHQLLINNFWVGIFISQSHINEVSKALNKSLSYWQGWQWSDLGRMIKIST